MPENLNFDEIYYYNTLKSGITVPATLKNNDLLTKIDAKVDTGAAFCIFERRHGEHLGLDIESGRPEVIGTATGTFSAYGHEITLSVLGIETTSTVYFAKDESFIRNVLGRLGWLDRVRLGLIDYDGKFSWALTGNENSISLRRRSRLSISASRTTRTTTARRTISRTFSLSFM